MARSVDPVTVARPARRRHRRERAQSMAEIALALPLFVVLTLGTADGGRAFYYREDVANAARQGLRAAVSDNNGSTQPYAGNQACAAISSGTSSKTAHIPYQSGVDPSYLATIANAAALESSSDGTTTGSRISGATITVTWHCKTGAAITNGTNGGTTDPSNAASDAVEVKVAYNFSLLTPLAGRLFGSSTPQISSDVVGRAEY